MTQTEDVEGPCEEVILQKAGLDLRLKEFFEQNRRIQDVHRRLMRKYDEKVVESILSFEHDLNSYAEPIRNVLKEQTEKLRRGEKELDLARYQRDVLKDEAERLKAIFQQLKIRDGDDTTGFRAPVMPNPHKVKSHDDVLNTYYDGDGGTMALWNADRINVRMTRLQRQKQHTPKEEHAVVRDAEIERQKRREERAKASVRKAMHMKAKMERQRQGQFSLNKFPNPEESMSDVSSESMVGTMDAPNTEVVDQLQKNAKAKAKQSSSSSSSSSSGSSTSSSSSSS